MDSPSKIPKSLGNTPQTVTSNLPSGQEGDQNLSSSQAQIALTTLQSLNTQQYPKSLENTPVLDKYKENHSDISELCLKSLGKVEKFFLTISAKLFPSLKAYLEKREAEHAQLIELSMTQKMNRSVRAVEAHRNLPKTNEDRTGLMELDAKLFLNEGELKVTIISHKKVAELAVLKGMHKGAEQGGYVAEVEVDGFGKLEAYSFGKNGLVKGKGVIPTSFILGDEVGNKEDHLTNAYVIHISNQQAVIRSGKIDSEQRADDFVALISDIHDTYVKETGNKGLKLRIVSQQLNSFEGESKMIDGQHRWIANVNQRLQDKAEVIHINVPSNRWYHYTRSIELLGFGSLVRKITPKNFFQGERLSKEQNLDSWGTYSKWAAADMTKALSDLSNPYVDDALKSLNDNQGALQDIKKNVDDLIQDIEYIKGELKNGNLDKTIHEKYQSRLKELNSELRASRVVLKDLLIQDQLVYSKIETALASIQNPSPEIVKALQTASLMRQVLGSQLGLEGQVLNRGKEGMALQLLNERLGVTAALNCKSGLDRTGLWHAVKLAMLFIGKTIGAGRSFALTNEWDKTTRLMNKISARLGQNDHIGSWLDKGLDDWKAKFGDLIPADMNEDQLDKLKEKIGDVIDLRKTVLKNLIKIGIPITTASTGMMGLKWNSSFQENLLPLNFLPTHVKKNGKQVALVKHEESGKISGISTIGRTLITKFQELRGS